ncbi:MAG: hypothetical protein E7456_04655 [Ruminococcaceae bacterium]|nr:hypothetical protein [Oscillospiraceae bacterium]
MKRILAIILTAIMLLTLVACGGKEAPEENSEPVESTTDENVTPEESEPADDEVKSVVTQYGSNPDYEAYTATIYCPEGAYFDEDEYAEYLTDGYLNDFWVYDDVRDYSTYSHVYWSRDIYNDPTELPTGYGVLEQLYFDGELAPETAAEYPEYDQKVIDLGFKWEDKDVKLIETTYTSADDFTYSEVFVGVEYTHYFWRVMDDGKVEDGVTAPGLFGFTVNGWDITEDQYAWIAGQLFGVDSGRTWDLEADEGTAAPVVNVDASALYGTWLERDSDWDNTYVFNEDGSGLLISGPEYPFTYAVSGDSLTLTYDDGDEESFTVSAAGSVLTLIDQFGNEIILDKSDEEIEVSDDSDLASALIGCWLDEEAGNNESFTFKADGRGVYTWKDDTYEFSYTLYDNNIDIRYDDGDHSNFYAEIEDGNLVLDLDWVLVRK